MTISVFDKYNTFIGKSDHLFQGLDDKAKKDQYPVHYDVRGRVNAASEKALQDLESWRTTPRGALGGVKKGFNGFINFFRKNKKNLKPKDPANEPYRFEPVDDAQKGKLEKRANFFKTLAKVALIVGVIFLSAGLFGPLGIVPLLFAVPEAAAFGIVVGCTIAGVFGAVSMVANPILKNCKAVREYRAKTDKDFQTFVETFVQGPSEPRKIGINFNASEKDVIDKKIHNVYLKWKESIEEALSEKKQHKLQQEAR